MRLNWFDLFTSLLTVAFAIVLSIVFQYFPQWAREYHVLENYPYAIFYGAILASILCLIGIFWASRKSAQFRAKQNNNNKPSIRIDTADIAKMTPEQLGILKELLSKLQGKKANEK